jgi:hypothetical protein
VDRSIVSFDRDDCGDWVARLDCGHGVHVRHRPPFQDRSWVLDERGRSERLGVVLNCPKCDQAGEPSAHLERR